MKRILIPIDFSECATHALRLGREMSIKNDAKLLLLHTVEHPVGGVIDPTGASVFQTFDDGLIDILIKRGRDKMSKLIADLDIAPDHVTQLVEIGHPSHLIIDKIRENSIDLVIIGTHGASGIREALVGSNAEKIVRSSPCPVISLKSATKLSDLKQIAFASDFSELNEEVMARLKQLQHFLDAEVQFVRVNTPNNFQRDKLTKKLMEKMIKVEMFLNASYHIYNDYSEEEGLLNFADDAEVNMLGLITHGRTGLNHLMTGSIAEDIVNHIDVPVWTMRMPD